MSVSSSTRRRSRPARAGLLTLALAAVAALGLLASSCGGSSGEGVAQVDSTQTITTGSDSPNVSKRAALVAFSACMRENGLPNFPDPKPSGGGLSLSLSFGPENGIDVSSPQFKTAQQACKKLLANLGEQSPQEQAEQLQQAREYSACMRENGVPNFPDPKASGDGGIQLNLGPSVDSSSPQFNTAEDACRQLERRAGDDPSTTGS
jgi:hypothetical protein